MKADYDVERWIKKRCLEDLDLRSPNRNERKPKDGVVQIVLREEEHILGIAEMKRMGGVVMLETVVVDPKIRGKGVSHILVEKVRKRWNSDPILSGRPLGQLDREEKERVPLDLVARTRSIAMASSLIRSGFTPTNVLGRGAKIRIRTAAIQWLRRMGQSLLIILFGEKLPERAIVPNGFLRKWMQKRRRLFHSWTAEHSYQWFILKPLEMNVQDGVYHHSNLKGRMRELGMEMAVWKGREERVGNSKEIEMWDEGGEIDEHIPFIDLTENMNVVGDE